MTDEQAAILAQYKFISVLDEAHGVSLMQKTSDRRLYLKKEMSSYDLRVIEWLRQNPVKNIPFIYEVIEDSGKLTVIEEYFAGSTLQELLDNGTLFTAGAVRDMSEQLFRILSDLHSAAPPIIHRAVDPSNILITPDRTVKLLEMNAARQFNGRPEPGSQLKHDLDYASPEARTFGEYSILSDIFSAGMVMKRMLKERAQPDDPGFPFLENVAWKCAQVDPNYRYQSASAIADTLHLGRDVENSGPSRLRRFLPPGYRREHPLYMLLFTAVYIIVFNVALTMRVPGAEPGRLWTVRVLALLMFLVLVFFSGDYLDCQKFLGIQKIRNRTVRVLVAALVDLVLAALFAWILFGIIRS